jgi:hypothetical protein
MGGDLLWQATQKACDSRFTCKHDPSGVEPRGFEALSSAVQRRHDTLLEVPEACKTLQITEFSHNPFPSISENSLGLLHSKLANTVEGLHCREDRGGRAQTFLIATKREDPTYLHSPISGW